ncbi:MAG TPA: hypothetical protein PLF35_13530 [Prolixibacteraceae bacterium]|nr:hypothetical protein [Prolixibacteraceae bacterium]
MFRYFIQLAYRGTRFHGWQIQPNAISVQEELNKALSVLTRETVNVVGAGRTDTGVHASFFVAHVDLQNELADPAQLAYKMNAFFPMIFVLIPCFWSKGIFMHALVLFRVLIDIILPVVKNCSNTNFRIMFLII